jgi:hypothetical protein
MVGSPLARCLILLRRTKRKIESRKYITYALPVCQGLGRVEWKLGEKERRGEERRGEERRGEGKRRGLKDKFRLLGLFF